MLIKQVIKQTIKWYCVCNKILNSGGQRTVGVGQLELGYGAPMAQFQPAGGFLGVFAVWVLVG